jgi:hypothetical protein
MGKHDFAKNICYLLPIGVNNHILQIYLQLKLKHKYDKMEFVFCMDYMLINTCYCREKTRIRHQNCMVLPCWYLTCLACLKLNK